MPVKKSAHHPQEKETVNSTLQGEKKANHGKSKAKHKHQPNHASHNDDLPGVPEDSSTAERDMGEIRALNSMARGTLMINKLAGNAPLSLRQIAKTYTADAKRLSTAQFAIHALSRAAEKTKALRVTETLLKAAGEVEYLHHTDSEDWVFAGHANESMGLSDFKDFIESLRTIKENLIVARDDMRKTDTQAEVERSAEAMAVFHDVSVRILHATKNLREVTSEYACNVQDALRAIREGQELCTEVIDIMDHTWCSDDLNHIKAVVQNAQSSLEEAARSARASVGRMLSNKLGESQENLEDLLGEKPSEDHLNALEPLRKASLPTVEQLENALDTLQEIAPDILRFTPDILGSPRHLEKMSKSREIATALRSGDLKRASTSSARSETPPLHTVGFIAPSMPKRPTVALDKLRHGVRRIAAGQSGLRFLKYMNEVHHTAANKKHNVSVEESDSQTVSVYEVTTPKARQGPRTSLLTKIKSMHGHGHDLKKSGLWQPWPPNSGPEIPADELGPALLDLFDDRLPPVRLAFHADPGPPQSAEPCVALKENMEPPRMPRQLRDPWEVVDSVFIGGAPEAQVVADMGTYNPWSVSAVLNLTGDWLPLLADGQNLLPPFGKEAKVNDIRYLRLPPGRIDSQLDIAIPFIESCLDFIESDPIQRSILVHCFDGKERAAAIGLAFGARKRCSCQNEVSSMIDEARRNLGGPSERDALFVVRSLALAFPQ